MLWKSKIIADATPSITCINLNCYQCLKFALLDFCDLSQWQWMTLDFELNWEGSSKTDLRKHNMCFHSCMRLLCFQCWRNCLPSLGCLKNEHILTEAYLLLCSPKGQAYSRRFVCPFSRHPCPTNNLNNYWWDLNQIWVYR